MKNAILFFFLIGSNCFCISERQQYLQEKYKDIESNLFETNGTLAIKSPQRQYIHFVHKLALGKPRVSSSPLITGDGFRAICDHIYDEQSLNFNPKIIKPGELVFVCNQFFEDFIQRFHNDIQHPYILITHNGDLPMPGPNYNILDEEKIIAWFSHNVEKYQHPKLYPLPIGVENSCFGRTDYLLHQKFSPENKHEKKHLCYLNLNPQTYPEERNYVIDLFKTCDYVLHAQNIDFPTYIDHTLSSHFTLSPRGNGLDCHRHWESIQMGTIPIIKHSDLDVLFEDLPVLLINDWTDVNEDYLLDQIEKISKGKYNFYKLDLEYWINQIYRKKMQFLQENK